MASMKNFSGANRYEFEDNDRIIVVIWATSYRDALDYWNELRRS